MHQPVQHTDHATERFLYVEQFVGSKFVQPTFVGTRSDEQVAVVVGEAVQHHDAERLPQYDKIAAAILRCESGAKKTWGPLLPRGWPCRARPAPRRATQGSFPSCARGAFSGELGAASDGRGAA